MIMTAEMKSTLENAPILTIVTMSADATPHPIIVGKCTVEEGVIMVGVYGMKVTQENLKHNDCAMMLGAQLTEAGAKGFRFTGNAKITDGKFIFTPTKVETLL